MGVRGRAASAATAIAALVALSSCSEGSAETEAWRQADTITDPSGFAWAVESRIHRADGSTIDVGEPVKAFFRAGDGVFYVPSGPEGDDDQLWFARAGEDAVPTGVHARSRMVAVSDDGRFVAELVPPGGGRDDPELRIFDLLEGSEATTSDHLDLGSEDPEQAWSEGEYHVLGFVDHEVLLGGPGTWAYDAATAESREVADDARAAGHDVVDNPSGTWRFDWDQNPATSVRSRSDDSRVAPRHEGNAVVLTGWVDDDTVHGVPLNSPEDPVLVTCEVPAGSCRVLEGTSGAGMVVLELDSGEGPLDLAAIRALGGG